MGKDLKALILNFYTGQRNKPGSVASLAEVLSPYYDISVPEFFDLTPTKLESQEVIGRC